MPGRRWCCARSLSLSAPRAERSSFWRRWSYGVAGRSPAVAHARQGSPACARSHFPAGLYPLARRAPNEGIAAARRAGPAVGLFADVLFAAMRRRRSATGSPRRERAQESARRALASLLSPCFARKIRLVHLMPEPLRPGPGRPLPAFRKWLVIRPIQGQDRRYFPKLKHWPLRSADAWR